MQHVGPPVHVHVRLAFGTLTNTREQSNSPSQAYAKAFIASRLIQLQLLQVSVMLGLKWCCQSSALPPPQLLTHLHSRMVHYRIRHLPDTHLLLPQTPKYKPTLPAAPAPLHTKMALHLPRHF
jgi:hypothetical protein